MGIYVPGLRTIRVRTREIAVKVLVDINGSVVERIGELVQDGGGGRRVAGPGLCPGVPACVAIARCKDQLCCIYASDSVNGCLVIRKDEVRVHVVRL